MIEVVRAKENWQKTGAYHVRIEGMGRQHHISLRDEFDDHDFDQSDYIVLLDDGYPVGTCRMYRIDDHSAMIGRVVVLPQYRGQKLGQRIMEEAERWLKEGGYRYSCLESRLEVVAFYEKLGYQKTGEDVIDGVTFSCIPMKKEL